MYNPYSAYGYPFMSQPSSMQNTYNTPNTGFTSYSQSQPQSQFSSAPATSGPDWIQVQNVDQIEQVTVQPGGKAWIMAQNEPIFALRTADQMGLVTTSYYKFEKYDPASKSEKGVSNFVTHEELEKRLSELFSKNNTSRTMKKEVAPNE